MESISYHIHQWQAEKKARGVVQIMHGMGEYANRYNDVVEFLTKKGFHVVLNDYRGHGASVQNVEDLGRITTFTQLVKDEIEVTRRMANEYPELPLFVLGHSMGSFLAQGHMRGLSPNLCSGYLLSGSCGSRLMIPLVGSWVGGFLSLFLSKKKSPFMKRLLFLGMNQRISDPQSKNAWLTRDEESVREYDEDPRCGFAYYTSFYHDFLRYLSALYQLKRFKSVSREIPVRIFSGEEDPVGLYGKGVKKLYQFYKEKLSFKEVEYHLYPEGRHEMFNELNSQEVLDDTLLWLEKILAQK